MGFYLYFCYIGHLVISHAISGQKLKSCDIKGEKVDWMSMCLIRSVVC